MLQAVPHTDTWINRYIMECKYILSINAIISTLWINRYIMECKCLSGLPKEHRPWELIDTLWNVNDFL